MSPAQIAANQANAQLSKGPVTPAGKEISSRNAETHGFCSKKFILKNEEQAEYNALREALITRHRPVGAGEIALADESVQSQWRLIRFRRTETAFLAQLIDQVREEKPELDEDEAMAAAFLQKEHAPKLRLFLRYQTAIERAHTKAVAELERAVKERRKREQDKAAAEAAVIAMEARRRHADAAKQIKPISYFENGFVPYSRPVAPAAAQTAVKTPAASSAPNASGTVK